MALLPDDDIARKLNRFSIQDQLVRVTRDNAADESQQKFALVKLLECFQQQNDSEAPLVAEYQQTLITMSSTSKNLLPGEVDLFDFPRNMSCGLQGPVQAPVKFSKVMTWVESSPSPSPPSRNPVAKTRDASHTSAAPPTSSMSTMRYKTRQITYGVSRPPATNDQDLEETSFKRRRTIPQPQRTASNSGLRRPLGRDPIEVDQGDDDKAPSTSFVSARQKANEDEVKKGRPPIYTAPVEEIQQVQVGRVIASPFANKPGAPSNGSSRKRPRDEGNSQDREYTYENPDHPLYKNLEPEMLERIHNEILDRQLNTRWDDIAGLEDVKRTLREMVILPHLHPQLFTGLRNPPRGLLLFGPPGNGKTLIAKAVATEANLTFLSISASSLTSKWIGEGEKMVKCLFAVARVKQPSFIFIDEIDSILTARGSEEHESTRRLKTEFLLRFDGATSGQDDERITVMGATNRPQDLDEAARRRLSKRIYVPLPGVEARLRLIKILLANERHSLTEADFDQIANSTDNYSGNDLSHLCKEAAMAPLRELVSLAGNSPIPPERMRPIALRDFLSASSRMKPSVTREECKHYEEWDAMFGNTGL